MAIRSLSDVNAAYESGRFHSQRYFKNASTNDLSWTDQSFSSGQPGYDARVGTANTFTPVIVFELPIVTGKQIGRAHV